MKLSDCCGCPPKGNGDCDSEDFGLCGDCWDHCTYIEVCEDCGNDIEECACKKAEPETLLTK